MVELAHALGVVTTAEGIEDQATLDALVELGCDHGQGFFVAKPMPAADLERWFASSPWANG